MPLSTLDPTPALVVIDLQKGIVSGTVAHVVPHAAALTQTFRQDFGFFDFPDNLILARRHDVAASPLRASQTEQHQAPSPPAERAGLVDDLDGAAEVLRRFLVRELAQRVVAGASRIIDRLLRVVATPEVKRQPFGDLRAVLVERLERLPDDAVQ